ncbi:hypothetical protein, partial [Enterococcus casseliflavus]|uniref:hypothetical protein n=1 Tax=Enterococcus casseliflavus TaxID=37734 RepID=UPI003D150BA9
GNSDEVLRTCERDNLFLFHLDGHGAWFRYHQLFAEALRERLNQSASEDDLADLHRRAAQWLRVNGHFEEAIRHATVARDWEHVVTML